MAPLGYIETLDAKGQVIERHGIEAWPLNIGRAYSNQIILNDAFVCPMHLALALNEQGKLLARDLDSVNGLHDNADARISTLELQSGTQFRIGHTTLRYCSIDHPLAPTALDGREKVSRLVSPYAAIAVGLLALVMFGLESFMSSVARVKAINIISEPLPMIGTLLGWAGLWALASRIVVSRFHFPQHVTIAGSAVIGFTLLSLWAEWLEFFFPALPVLWSAALFGSGLILAALVYGHLGFASPLRRRSRLWTALIISGLMIGMNGLNDYAARSKFSTVMDYNGILKPVDAGWVPAVSLEQFFTNSQKLKTELDNLARKAKATP
ncbi:MAG: FHA domain-containing protein [Deltaproteobacteria bacterium]|nr:FHA domain-containing protein [Deltaproteobacteria bacterium]